MARIFYYFHFVGLSDNHMFGTSRAHVELVRVFFVGLAHSQPLAVVQEERLVVDLVP